MPGAAPSPALEREPARLLHVQQPRGFSHTASQSFVRG